MKTIRDLKEITPELRECVMTIGNFDGVHLAHQKIIHQVVDEARRSERRSVVMTFEPHPQKILHPDQVPFYLITTLEEKLSLLEGLQVDAAVVLEFTRAFSRTTAEAFIRNIICGRLQPRKVLIGHDYTFGKGKEGKPEYLQAMGRQCGFAVEIIPAFRMNDGIVSSTRVRHAIQDGKVEEAARFLGRPYNVSGAVVRGFQRGSGIGFPTANVSPGKELLPPEGVYAVYVEWGGARHSAVANIGFNPTFANESLSLEIHLLDFRGDLYRSSLNVLFIQRLREERKFESPEKLAEQIGKDVERARKILAGA